MVNLSVIVPVYNTARYLKRCVDSILGQSYRDFEILLIDDGATDGSADICDQYARQDVRIRVIHKENGGSSSARIAGIKASKGEFIGFVDSDDWIESDMYKKLMAAFDSDVSIDISVGGHVVEKQNGCIVHPLKPSSSVKFTSHQALEEMFLGEKYIWSLCDKVYKKTLLNSGDMLNKWPDSFGEDTFANVYTFSRASYIVFQPVYGYHYCINEDSMTHQAFSKKQLAYFYIWDKIIDTYRVECPGIVYNVWKIMLSSGMAALNEMHHKFYLFHNELLVCQQILRKHEALLGISDRGFNKYKFSILMKSNKEFIEWETERNRRVKKFVKQNRYVYIYGGGSFANKVTKLMNDCHIYFDGYVVSDLKQDNCILNGKNVFCFDDIVKENCCFLLGMNEENTQQVIPTLKKYKKSYLKMNELIF